MHALADCGTCALRPFQCQENYASFLFKANSAPPEKSARKTFIANKDKYGVLWPRIEARRQ
ncbi:MAG: hypothetical protein PHN61_11485, partial [Methanothrix sp.]|nr:hypothetical protein [Methanothrix sp.]